MFQVELNFLSLTVYIFFIALLYSLNILKHDIFVIVYTNVIVHTSDMIKHKNIPWSHIFYFYNIYGLIFYVGQNWITHTKKVCKITLTKEMNLFFTYKYMNKI